MSNLKKVLLVLLSVLLVLSLTACGSGSSNQQPQQGSSQQQDSEKTWKPESTVEIVAPANPGGGWDLLSRNIQSVVTEQKLVDQPIIITNKPGGGGAVGWTYLKGKKGNGSVLAVNSSLILLNNLLGSSELSYKDFTPLANLTTEWEVVAVAKDSPYTTGKELLDALKADPSKLSIGVGPTLGNDDHIQFLQICKAYGIDVSKLNFIVYPGAGGEEITNLLGHHIDLITISMAETLEQYRAGNLRILGVSSPERVPELQDVPTWKEQGIDVVFAHWRGIMGPPDMTPEQVKYWSDVFAKMVQSDKWKELLKNQGQYDYYMPADEYTKFLDDQNNTFSSLLKEVGLTK
ncbi:MAG: tripartite tricarboxylate transporter substrate binding protein [Thermoanaerobacteraceae bacterium]|nr:tripartite tricarboxylate transporter substrate binding protein [Thermoanaerobacteraceae bacterium]